ncbi:LysE family translocator [Bacillus atrophaeus]|uniref:LysE family translocator n=1 Tax=Bacillus atrophaeus TaxID=1452 RepID=UPI002281784D|nr:LysE family translocator [Bacillus atrophaeus]MCY8515832.1 LysE family translocator [Bacillus atrophaeus]MCY8519583.1 LysE family translocator [Bacillus atrophaeus]MCY8991293.1 LysE family translocator [Bacillus atrophaeus]MCY9111883.1 LysE family translocator [Bacillus atrophaeus]
MENYLLFIFTAILIIIMPGPGFALVTKNTLSHGRKGGIKTVLGTVSGMMIHTVMATLGLSAILMKSAILFTIIKYAGAVYLIYLAVKSIKSAFSKKENIIATEDAKVKVTSTVKSFRQGFITAILNPKTTVFFLSFLPQFIVSNQSHFFQFLLLGLTFTILTGIWYLLYIVLIHKLRIFLKKESINRTIEGVMGTVLLAFGIRLFFQK